MNPPANWYPDPTGRHGQRYWDGEQWTEHVFTDGVQDVDPLDTVADETTDDEQPTDDVVSDEDLTDDVVGDEADELPAATTEVDDDGAAAPATDTAAAADPAELDTQQPDEPVEEAAVAPQEVDTTAGLFTNDPVAEPDEAAWTPDAATDDAGGVLAPEVEPSDVVAAVDEVDASTPDFSDAFVLSPETASRLVRRSETTAPDEASVEEPAGNDPAADPGAIDAPPPTAADGAAPAPTDVTPAALGLHGDLVEGAFAEREDAGAVALQNARLLRCSASGGLIARQGTMVAYQGDVSFERQGAGGVGRALKRATTGEGLAMMRVSGTGDVFLADAGQHVFVLHLDGGPGLSVNGRNVLAFSAALQWDIERVKGASLLAGGLFNTTITGTGWVALVSDGEPVVLRTDEAQTQVDVNALVAWSAGLSTQIVNTASAKSLVGLGSGEAFQMAFEGAGIVIVQPSEGPLGSAG